MAGMTMAGISLFIQSSANLNDSCQTCSDPVQPGRSRRISTRDNGSFPRRPAKEFRTMSIFKKAALGTALAATALVSASPAMARDYNRNHANTTAVDIRAGVIGLALGANLPSHTTTRDPKANHHRNHNTKHPYA